jgi:hypothetical protein
MDGQGSIPDRDKVISLLHNIQTGIGIHPAPLFNGSQGSILEVSSRNMKLTTPPYNIEDKNGEALLPLPYTSLGAA